MNSKHPEDIHGHLQRAKEFFYNLNISEYFQIFPNISKSKFFFIPNQWETLMTG